jgi:putative zinc finger/helix-turn-helix YgiT family protein
MKNGGMNCPNDHGEMLINESKKDVIFRGVDITYPVKNYRCPICNLEAGTIEQTAENQRAISEAYREAVDMMTGYEIRECRMQQKLTQQALADKMKVGVASIKRWEKGLIQSKSMDQALRRVLQCQIIEDHYTGNRDFSIPRIKLVLCELESIMGKRLLKKDDKMLFASKYLWYVDMVSYRDLGKSMTGSTYARLPYGPQLNNYRDLVDEIKNANEASAEPLTIEEKRILEKIAMKFPEEQMVYEAAHREKIWQRKSNGEIIPYPDAIELTEI